MTHKIIDLTHRRYEPVLKMLGRSGKQYMFRWDADLGRYAHTPEDQTAIDDLFEGAMHWNHTYLSIIIGPPEPEAVEPEDAPEPVKKTSSRRKKQTMAGNA